MFDKNRPIRDIHTGKSGGVNHRISYTPAMQRNVAARVEEKRRKQEEQDKLPYTKAGSGKARGTDSDLSQSAWKNSPLGIRIRWILALSLVVIVALIIAGYFIDRASDDVSRGVRIGRGIDLHDMG
jgi:hypothetical protein